MREVATTAVAGVPGVPGVALLGAMWEARRHEAECRVGAVA
jgi:hypothetical protein